MAPRKRTTKVNGIDVPQVEFGDNWYTTVDGRVKIAEQADPIIIRKDGHGYHVTEVKIIQMGDQWAYHCMVEYPVGSGCIRPGSDFIDMSDKKSGLAKAETSAIGRALGLHGIAIESGIASADEMSRVPTENLPATTPQATPARPQKPTAAPTPISSTGEVKLGSIRALLNAHGFNTITKQDDFLHGFGAGVKTAYSQKEYDDIKAVIAPVEASA